MIEIWKNIYDYEEYYQVSNFGRVKSLHRIVKYSCGTKFRTINERILKQGLGSKGYYQVVLCKKGARKNMNVHQLVAICFHEYKQNGLLDFVVNHKDTIKTNNYSTNLEIITHRENSNKLHIKSTSEYVGVHWHKATKKWQASISIKRKMYYLGVFKTELEANEAYQNRLKEINK